MVYVDLFFQGLALLGSVGFLAAVFYAFKLSRETENEHYWLGLAFSALFLGISEWVIILVEFDLIMQDLSFIISQISLILGALTFAYATYGISRAMEKIRKKME